jgi:hypothetical protein
MGKVKKDNRLKLHQIIDKVPTDKVDYIQGILEGVLLSFKENGEKKITPSKTNIQNLLSMAGTLKLPKNFDAVKWQRKLRDEWPD